MAFYPEKYCAQQDSSALARKVRVGRGTQDSSADVNRGDNSLYYRFLIFSHLSDKTHKSCKVLNSAHICSWNRSSLNLVQTLIKSRHDKAALAAKAALVVAAKAAKVRKTRKVSIATKAAEV